MKQMTIMLLSIVVRNLKSKHKSNTFYSYASFSHCLVLSQLSELSYKHRVESHEFWFYAMAIS